MLIKVLKSLFCGFVTGYLLSVVLSNWIWLEMRMNTSLIILIMTILGGIFGGVKKFKVNKMWFYGAEIFAFIIFIIFYQDLSALSVIPAVKFKEAFFLSFLTISNANIILIILLLIGNVLWFIPNKYDY